MQTVASTALLADAGRLVDRHAMVWLRRIEAPVDRVWRQVATKDGLAAWWMVPPRVFEPLPGGSFEHHWGNVVLDIREREYIAFGSPAGSPTEERMRFDLRADGAATMFAFMDTWAPGMGAVGTGELAEQPGGPGTPWPGVAAGWHNSVDTLAHVLGAPAGVGYETLCAFYVGYLRDLYHWRAIGREVLGAGDPAADEAVG